MFLGGFDLLIGTGLQTSEHVVDILRRRPPKPDVMGRQPERHLLRAAELGDWLADDQLEAGVVVEYGQPIGAASVQMMKAEVPHEEIAGGSNVGNVEVKVVVRRSRARTPRTR
jgi:hypothetical protein